MQQLQELIMSNRLLIGREPTVFFAAVLGMLLSAQAIAQQDDARMPIQQFVGQMFIHGVPYEEVIAYGPAVVPELIAVLRDPGREAQWANAAVMLAMIGDQRGVDAVLEFVREPGPGGLTPYREWARGNAVLALGYAAHGGRNRTALRYLEEGLDPGAWARRGVRGAQTRPSRPDADADADYEEEDAGFSADAWLTNQAVVGLALSGTPEGRRALERLRAAPGRPTHEAASLDDLLREHARVAQVGLREYDRARQQRPAHVNPGVKPPPQTSPSTGAPGQPTAPAPAPRTGPE
jgi:hypothetical protein